MKSQRVRGQVDSGDAYRAGQRRFLRGYTVMVLWALLLTPTLPTPASLPSLRFDDVFLIVAPGVVAVAFSRVFLDRRVLFILLIAVSVEVGIFVGASLGYPASLLDHFYLFRMAKYLGAIIIGSALVYSEKSSSDALYWLTKKTVVPGLLLVLLVVQQYFNLGGLNDYYVKLVAPTQYETLVGGYPWPRPVGMVGNPNELSFLLGILSLSSTWMAFHEREKPLKWVFLGLIFLAASALTMSRSGLFATFGALAILIGSQVAGAFRLKVFGIVVKKRGAAIAAAIMTAFLGSGAAVSLNDSLYDEIVWRFSPDYYGGFYKRVENWSENIQLWQESPLFGVGTLKHSGFLEHAADNEWLLLARTGGVLLVGLVVSLFSIGLLRKTLVRGDKYLSRALVFGAALYMVPAAFFYSLVIFPLSLIILTVATPSPWKVLMVPKEVIRSTSSTAVGVSAGSAR